MRKPSTIQPLASCRWLRGREEESPQWEEKLGSLATTPFSLKALDDSAQRLRRLTELWFRAEVRDYAFPDNFILYVQTALAHRDSLRSYLIPFY